MKPTQRRPRRKARAVEGAGLFYLLARLGPFTQALAAAATAWEVAEVLAAQARALADADTCRVALLTPDGAAWSAIRESGFAPGADGGGPFSPGDSRPLCEAIRQRKALFLEGPGPDAPGGSGAEAALPLAGGAMLGAFSLGFARPRRFAPDERLFLNLAAQVATLALERAQAVERVDGLRAEALEDESTLHQIVAAQEEERRRFSRELHDGTGQFLTVLALKLRVLRDALAPETEAQGALRQMERLVEEMGREIHHLAVRLRPTALDDQGLSGALQDYLEEWTEHTGMAVDLHTSGLDETRLPVSVKTVIYRIVQEALTNVFKHADAAHVSLILEQDDGSVCAIIEDDGGGFDTDGPSPPPQDRRLGIMGMNERAAAAGGQCTIESSPGGGTTIFLRLPLGRGASARARKDRP